MNDAAERSALEAHLETEGRNFMVSLRADGSPTCHPMGTFYADGRLFLNMYAKSRKHKNLERDPQVACLVTTAPDQPDFRAAIVRGTARQLPLTEVLADDAGRGIRKALRMEVAEQADSFTDSEGRDLVRRTDAMRSRIRAGVRVLWEVEPDLVSWLDAARQEGHHAS